MRITLRYFASIRQALGRREDVLEVPEGMTVAQVWERLVRQHAQLAQQRYRPAVNQEYAAPEAILHEGDELVFIPPVSGGRQQQGSASADRYVFPLVSEGRPFP